MEKAGRFFDGCHKYGWLIAIAVQLMTIGVLYGRMDQAVEDVRADVQILKSQVYDLAHAARRQVEDATTPEYQRRKKEALKKDKEQEQEQEKKP